MRPTLLETLLDTNIRPPSAPSILWFSDCLEDFCYKYVSSKQTWAAAWYWCQDKEDVSLSSFIVLLCADFSILGAPCLRTQQGRGLLCLQSRKRLNREVLVGWQISQRIYAKLDRQFGRKVHLDRWIKDGVQKLEPHL